MKNKSGFKTPSLLNKPRQGNLFCRDFETAFTLLEILLGIGIFSLIALSVYSVFGNALRIQQRLEQMSRQQREARFVFSKMTRDIENMLLYGQDQSNHNTLVNIGEENQLTFFSFQKTGLKIVSYYLHTADFGSVQKTLVGQKFSKLRSVTVNQKIAEEQAQTLIREENAIGSALTTDPTTSAADEKAEQDILSDQIQPDGLHFYYAHLEKGEGDHYTIAWESEMHKGAALLGIRIELTFLPFRKDQQPLTLTRDVLLPATALSKL